MPVLVGTVGVTVADMVVGVLVDKADVVLADMVVEVLVAMLDSSHAALEDSNAAEQEDFAEHMIGAASA